MADIDGRRGGPTADRGEVMDLGNVRLSLRHVFITTRQFASILCCMTVTIHAVNDAEWRPFTVRAVAVSGSITPPLSS